MSEFNNTYEKKMHEKCVFDKVYILINDSIETIHWLRMTYFDTYYHGKRIGNRIRPRLASRKSNETILILFLLLPSTYFSFLFLPSFKNFIDFYFALHFDTKEWMSRNPLSKKERKPNYDFVKENLQNRLPRKKTKFFFV